MKKYICVKCGEERHSRERIRNHIREIHEIKGFSPEKEPHSPKTTSDISKSYRGVKIKEDKNE